MCLLKHVGGAFTHRPEELKGRLSQRASQLVEASFADVNHARLVDYHTHVAGVGAGGTGNRVNPKMRTWRHPFHRAKFAIYLSAAGVEDLNRADAEFAERLVRLVSHIEPRGRYRLLAFDKHYRQDGTVNEEKTEFYVPNEYVFDLAARHPELFEPVISVHPYRADAVEELERWAARGGRMVKWLPNAMGIDPSDSACDPFYSKMKELGLVLLSHGGEEKAVEAEEDQKLGNPLLLRRALEHGVRVIVAHCASLGENEDLDDPDGKRVHNFRLFMRLMREKSYEGLLFGDISAMTQFNRIGEPLSTVIESEELHGRLVNGSDYPLPAVNLLIRTGPLVRAGYITAEEGASLREIYGFNPLLFDYVLKRSLRLPGTKRRLPPRVFESNPALDV
ncbi:MAG TPA: amidohydrolase family protein [Pyrinomonadaceae bacterium]|nr:amidohydrolase family protein [Pyrinomonadaceae bacterium]